MRIVFGFLFIVTASLGERALANPSFFKLLNSFQNINKQTTQSCNLIEEKHLDFCSSPSDFLCEDISDIENEIKKGHLAIDKLAKKSLLERNSSGKLEWLDNKLPANVIKNPSEESLEAILKDEKNVQHTSLNYNYTLAANDLIESDQKVQEKLNLMLNKVKDGMKRFLATNARFKACKDQAFARLDKIKFGQLRNNHDVLDGCGGSKLLEQASVNRPDAEVILCPGILKSGFLSKDFNYLTPILAHEIGHLLEGSLLTCYPNDCISELPGGFMEDEKQAEWLAVKALPYIEDAKGNPSAKQLESVLIPYGKYLCRMMVYDPAPDQYTSHPRSKDRIDVYYGKDPQIRKILHCPNQINSIKSCE